MSYVLVVSADRSTETGYATNLGDAFLTDSLAARLEEECGPVKIVDFGAPRSDGGRARVHVPHLWSYWRLVRGARAVVMGGGTLLQDDVQKGVGGLPRLVLFTSMVSWMARTRAYFFAVGVDPVSRHFARAMLRLAVLGRPVWVRDARSAERFSRMFGRPPGLAADAALLWPVGDVAASGTGVIVALNRVHASELTPSSVTQLKATFGEVYFLQMSQGGRFRDADGLPKAETLELDDISESLTWELALKRYARAHSVVGSRMHGLYMGMLTGKSLAAIGDSAKVRAFAEEFGVPVYGSLAAAASDVGNWRPAAPQAVAGAVGRVERGLAELVSCIKGGV